MANFISYDRTQAYLLPPDLRDWLPEDDLAHFVVAAVERVDLAAFKINDRGSGKAQYHPRMMLALLIYCYANGIFSSRRIERATHRDLGVRFVAADRHPDHDTIATFRTANAKAIEAAFLTVLMIAGEMGLLRLGTVAIDGTKIDASASKIRSVRYDRANALVAKLEADIAALMAQAEAADAEDAPDPQALPAEIARREALKEKLEAACRRLEAEAAEERKAAQAVYEEKKAAYDAKTGRRGRPPVPPDDDAPPPPARQSNLTDPDSSLMRKSQRHEYRQAYNAQAVVDAEGPQLVLAAGVSTCASDAPGFAETVLAMAQSEGGPGLPGCVLADAGFADGDAVAALEAAEIEALVAIGRTQSHRPYDFRPPPVDPKPPPEPKAAWRKSMKAKLESDDGKARYKLRKQSVEPVFGIIKAVLGFTRFSLRGLAKVESEWTLVSLAYNCKRLCALAAAA